MQRNFTVSNYSNLPALTAEEAEAALNSSLEDIITSYPPTPSRRPKLSGFFYGPTSVSFLLFSLSQYYWNSRIQSKSLLDWAKAYLDLSLTHVHRSTVDPSHCGVANERLTTLAMTAVLYQDGEAVEQICRYLPAVLVEDDDISCEWLYGLSGFLYLLRMCKYHVPDCEKMVKVATRDIVDFILSHQPWLWHGMDYVGAAHGAIGIITQLVLSEPSEELLRHLTPTVSRILQLQLSSGNFSSSARSSWDELVQFCHGAPGFLISLRTLLPFFPSLRAQILSVIVRCERCIIERGVLCKMPCLCHGVYGNALSLPRQDMLKFLKLTCPMGLPWDESEDLDTKYGLFTGEGGRAWAMAVAKRDNPFEFGRIVGYNDI
jgi:hypothetical protein